MVECLCSVDPLLQVISGEGGGKEGGVPHADFISSPAELCHLSLPINPPSSPTFLCFLLPSSLAQVTQPRIKSSPDDILHLTTNQTTKHQPWVIAPAPAALDAPAVRAALAAKYVVLFLFFVSHTSSLTSSALSTSRSPLIHHTTSNLHPLNSMIQAAKIREGKDA
jgi:hypothetical protein